jgi:hypothetical protein
MTIPRTHNPLPEQRTRLDFMEKGVNAGVQTEGYTHKITHKFSVFRPREEHPQIENVEKNYPARHFLVLRNLMKEVGEIARWQASSTDKVILTKASKSPGVGTIEDSQCCPE